VARRHAPSASRLDHRAARGAPRRRRCPTAQGRALREGHRAAPSRAARAPARHSLESSRPRSPRARPRRARPPAGSRDRTRRPPARLRPQRATWRTSRGAARAARALPPLAARRTPSSETARRALHPRARSRAPPHRAGSERLAREASARRVVSFRSPARGRRRDRPARRRRPACSRRPVVPPPAVAPVCSARSARCESVVSRRLAACNAPAPPLSLTAASLAAVAINAPGSGAPAGSRLVATTRSPTSRSSSPMSAPWRDTFRSVFGTRASARSKISRSVRRIESCLRSRGSVSFSSRRLSFP
jgi:hypothetical protein